MQTILIVEDDNNINQLLKEALSKAGYNCEQAFSGTEARMLFQMKQYSLVLLDLMLPGISGEEVLQEIRKQGNVPVIVLTAKDQMDEKLNLLTGGADDYITKPFDVKEVLARVQIQLRHAQKEPVGTKISYRELTVDKTTFQVQVNDKTIPNITRQEFAILVYLEKNEHLFGKSVFCE